ncbi:hypothetical protein [Pseudorhizobium flavum]|uniref:hypothetical protein n=1 Tax=Pseudorhizobium flavum TaxID=1335061 RepID=UPI00249248D6|nr:hypothetical protein [Pseudorhizobium flavum]
MSADIVTFPVAVDEQRVRLVKSEIRDWQMSQIMHAGESLDAARLDLSSAASRLHQSAELSDSDALLAGQVLESALIAVVSITNVMGATNMNREIARAARLWLQANGSTDDAG